MNNITKQRLALAQGEEIWKTVEEFPDYEVSNFGKVRKWYLTYYRYPNPAKAPNGSLKISFIEDGGTHARMLGKVVYETFMGCQTNTHDINYLDGDKTNCALSNLVTTQELILAFQDYVEEESSN